MTQHQREQPDHPLDTWLVGENRAEMGEVDLGLAARRRLEAHLETRGCTRPDPAEEDFDHGVATAVTKVAQLTVQPAGRQLGIGGHTLAQIRLERGDLADARRSRLIGRN